MQKTTVTEQFPQSADAVFCALESHGSADGHSLTDRDQDTRTVAFRTPSSLFSWGHEVRAHVLPVGRSAQLTLTVTGVPGGPQALLDGRQNRAAAQRVLTALRAHLES